MLNARLACTPTNAASRTSAELSTEYGVPPLAKRRCCSESIVAQAVLPAEVAADVQRLLRRQIEGLQHAHTEGAQYRITLVAGAFQCRGVALLREAFGVQMHVREVGERLQCQRLQVQSIRRFAEHLRGARIDLGFLFAADVAVLQIAFHIGAMPAVRRAGAQAPGADFMAGVRAEVIAVDLGR